MKREYSTLIIDDHPLILDAYKNAFEFISLKNSDITFKISLARDCDTAYQKVLEATKSNAFDIILLDIGLPSSKDGKILSGEDLGIKINKLLPKTKIIISTAFHDRYRIHSILKSVNPDGFIIKTEVAFKEIVHAIETVIRNSPYYSATVLNVLRKQVSSEYTLNISDRKLLYELSIGTKMKELPNILAMSLTAIEKKKHFFKEMFDVEGMSDRGLVLKAMEKGFI